MVTPLPQKSAHARRGLDHLSKSPMVACLSYSIVSLLRVVICRTYFQMEWSTKVNQSNGANRFSPIDALDPRSERERETVRVQCVERNASFAAFHQNLDCCTASSSHFRTILLESSSWPLPVKCPNHAT